MAFKREAVQMCLLFMLSIQLLRMANGKTIYVKVCDLVISLKVWVGKHMTSSANQNDGTNVMCDGFQ